MVIILWIAGVLFTLASVLTVVRIVRGPGAANRVVATDVLIATVVGGLVIEAAVNRHAYTIPVILVLALVAFSGTVSMARFVAGRQEVFDSGPDAEISRERGIR